MNRFINSKWFALGELVYNLIIINLLILIGCLGVLTVGPSLCAGYRTVQALRRGQSEGLVTCFILWYKSYLAKGSLLTLIGLLWLPAIRYWVALSLASDSAMAVIVVGLLCTEILMSLLGAFVVLIDRGEKGAVALIGAGILYFHCFFGRFFMMTAVFLTSVWLLSSLVLTLPVAVSGSFYLLAFLRASRALKLEGDNPVNFRKVFEKVN